VVRNGRRDHVAARLELERFRVSAEEPTHGVREAPLRLIVDGDRALTRGQCGQ
jgi:hypothetical protein